MAAEIMVTNGNDCHIMYLNTKNGVFTSPSIFRILKKKMAEKYLTKGIYYIHYPSQRTVLSSSMHYAHYDSNLSLIRAIIRSS